MLPIYKDYIKFLNDKTENTSFLNGLDIEIARNFFCHKCKKCGKRIKDKSTIGMNMKIYNREATDMWCKKHLMEILEIDEETWNKYIDIFKQQGCTLF